MMKFENPYDHIIEKKPEETATLAEVVLDTNSVCIPLERFEQLIKAEIIAAVVRTAYETRTSWDIEATIAMLFPDAKKVGKENVE